MENIFNIEVLLYAIFIMISSIGLSSLNFNNMFKKNKVVESRILIVIFSVVLGYLTANFVIDFLDLASIL